MASGFGRVTSFRVLNPRRGAQGPIGRESRPLAPGALPPRPQSGTMMPHRDDGAACVCAHVAGGQSAGRGYGRTCPAEDAEIGSSGRRPQSTVGCTALRIGAYEPSAVAYKGKELWTYVGRGRSCSAFLPGCSPAALCWGAGSD
jgi:hypothetical protein